MWTMKMLWLSIAKTNLNDESSIESDEDDNNCNDDYDDINDRGYVDVDDVDWNLHLFHLKCDAHFQNYVQNVYEQLP